MSLELLVILSGSNAPSGEAWAQALSQAHSPVSFVQPLDVSRQTGFVPMLVYGRSSGFYFLRESYPELARLHKPIANLRLDNPVVYALGFGGHADECIAASLSAVALVSTFNGVAFDPQGGALVTARQLRDGADQCAMLPVP